MNIAQLICNNKLNELQNGAHFELLHGFVIEMRRFGIEVPLSGFKMRRFGIEVRRSGSEMR